MSSATQQVANGADYLDGAGIDDWHNKINRETLDMWSTHDCVLGQLFGRDAYESLHHDLGVVWIVDHGFAPGILQHEAWITEIEARRERQVSLA